MAQTKAGRIAVWIFTILIGLLMAFSATMKLGKAQAVVEIMGKWGLGDKVLLIGIAELVSTLLFVIPRTSSLGVLLLSAYLGGAIVTQMQHGEPYITPAVLLVMVWIIGYLRNPEIFRSLKGQPA